MNWSQSLTAGQLDVDFYDFQPEKKILESKENVKNEENGKQPSQEKDQTVGVEEKENEEATELPSNKKTDEVYGNFINSLRLPALMRRLNIS